MDALQYDAYSNYSDGSTPRTPSPGSDFNAYHSSPAIHNIKPAYEPFVRAPEDGAFGIEATWAPTAGGPIAISHSQGHPRGSLLNELYDHELPPASHPHHPHHPHHPQEVYLSHSAEPPYGAGAPADWSATGPQHHQTLPPMRAPHDGMVRRNTFPYVRHDHDAAAAAAHHFGAPGPYVDHHHGAGGSMLAPYGAGRPDVVYGEPMPLGGSPHMPLAAEPSALHEPYHHHHHHPHAHPHAHPYGLEHDAVKLEDGPVIVPSQAGFYRPPSSGGGVPMPAYLSPHTGLPIQHTDDAASKETQYLRRRCFNCHTTEPPSWRRSTLNPGKIVCNKCGLYERTHLRPRPLRFDELRAGNKARKQTKTATGAAAGASPKQARAVKKEPREHVVGAQDSISRRASVSSNASTTSSSLGASSDWEENGSFGSAPGSGFSSPAQSTFSIPRDSASASPPMMGAEGGIRLPNAPLSDLAAMDGGASSPMPRKAATTGPNGYFSGATPTVATGAYGSPRLAPAPAMDGPYRRNTVTLPLSQGAPAEPRTLELQETGWHTVPMHDLTPQEKASPKTTPRSKPVPVA